MAHKCRDNGTAYEVVGGKVRDNGTSYAISHGKINSSGTVYEIPFSSGTPLSELSVGSTVKMNVNGASKEFIVVHQGKPSSLYDDSCNGTWVLMKDVYEKRQWNSSNSNSYANSTIHTYLNGTFLSLFDAGIKTQIKTVKIPYLNGTTSSSAVASGSGGLSAQIFLLSGYEVGWTQSSSSYLPIDGACLSYFSGTATTDSKRIGYMNGTATYWWVRSPYTRRTGYAFVVGTNGGFSNSNYQETWGIRPALVLPSEACVDENFNIIA